MKNKVVDVRFIILEGNPEDFKTVIDTNLLAVCSCSKEAFSQMKEFGLEGHIVHINSVSGHWATAGYPMFMNVYSPVKHALTCLTECMRQEVLHTNTHVRVTVSLKFKHSALIS